MTKDRKYFTFLYPLKFKDTQIKLNLNGIILTKKSYIESILSVIDHITDFTSFRKIIKKKLLPKE